MNGLWSLVPLSKVLKPISRPERVDPEKSYNILGAHWYAKGLYTKSVANGSEIQANQLYRVERGDFVYNRLFGWKGSFALATEEDDGCYVSNEFPCFMVRSDTAHGTYLWRYFSLPSVWDEVFGLSTGGTPTSRNRLKEAQLLAMRIPLPTLDEQHRLVSRIEELSAKIEEARGLRQRAVEEVEVLLNAVMRRIFVPGIHPEVTMESVCAAIIDNLHSNPVYAAQGVPCIRSSDVGRGKLNLVTALRTSEEEYLRRTVRGEPSANDVVLVREGGGTGKAAIVQEGQRFSLAQRVMMLRPDQKRILPKFMLYQILSPSIYDEQILELTKGSASPHLNIGALRKFRFYLPSIEEQRHIVAYLDSLQAKVDSMRSLQDETAKELDTLMPSILSRAFSGSL